LATSTQIVWTFVFEILFLHESLNIWSLAGTALILGYMMVVGIIKVIESRKHADVDTVKEEGMEVDEEDLLLMPSKQKNGYGSTPTQPILQWQGSLSL